MSQTQQQAQQTAIGRITSVRQQVEQIHNRTVILLEKTLEDSANFQLKHPNAEMPFTLTEPSIVELTRARNELAQLLAYYDTQLNTILAAARQAKGQPSQAEQANDLALQMRARVEQLAQQEVDTVNVPDAASNGVQATSYEVLPSTVVAATESPDTLPVEEPIAEGPKGLPSPPIPENSLERLVGKNSPLLQIFAPGPWLPEGKGQITVGTNNAVGNFRWYKTIDPAAKDALERAKLPTGFYGGDSRPSSVVLRMDNSIVHWTFGLTHEEISVFMIGLSNTDPNNLRWFKSNELSASFTRKLIAELATVLHKLEQAQQ